MIPNQMENPEINICKERLYQISNDLKDMNQENISTNIMEWKTDKIPLGERKTIVSDKKTDLSLNKTYPIPSSDSRKKSSMWWQSSRIFKPKAQKVETVQQFTMEFMLSPSRTINLSISHLTNPLMAAKYVVEQLCLSKIEEGIRYDDKEKGEFMSTHIIRGMLIFLLHHLNSVKCYFIEDLIFIFLELIWERMSMTLSAPVQPSIFIDS